MSGLEWRLGVRGEGVLAVLQVEEKRLTMEVVGVGDECVEGERTE